MCAKSGFGSVFGSALGAALGERRRTLVAKPRACDIIASAVRTTHRITQMPTDWSSCITRGREGAAGCGKGDPLRPLPYKSSAAVDRAVRHLHGSAWLTTVHAVVSIARCVPVWRRSRMAALPGIARRAQADCRQASGEHRQRRRALYPRAFSRCGCHRRNPSRSPQQLDDKARVFGFATDGRMKRKSKRCSRNRATCRS